MYIYIYIQYICIYIYMYMYMYIYKSILSNKNGRVKGVFNRRCKNTCRKGITYITIKDFYVSLKGVYVSSLQG